MDDLTYFFLLISEVIMPLIGWISVFSIPWLVPFLYYKVIPKTARTFIAAKRKNMIPALIVHDSGRAVIVLVKEKMGGGICVTEQGRYKLLPKYVEAEEITSVEEAAAFPEEAESKNKTAGSEEETTESETETTKPRLKTLIKMFGDWVTKRCILVGLGKPMLIGYSGKACLLNPSALALWEAGKMKIRDQEHRWMREKVKQNEKGEPDENGKIPKIQELLQPLMLLDARACKAVISPAYDESQIAAMCVDSEKIGMIGRGLPKWALPLILIVVVVGGLAFLIMVLTGVIPMP